MFLGMSAKENREERERKECQLQSYSCFFSFCFEVREEKASC